MKLVDARSKVHEVSPLNILNIIIFITIKHV